MVNFLLRKMITVEILVGINKKLLLPRNDKKCIPYSRVWAHSSEVEHYVDIVVVVGSIPAVPTISFLV